jgi:hypothetical protein
MSNLPEHLLFDLLLERVHPTEWYSISTVCRAWFASVRELFHSNHLTDGHRVDLRTLWFHCTPLGMNPCKLATAKLWWSLEYFLCHARDAITSHVRAILFTDVCRAGIPHLAHRLLNSRFFSPTLVIWEAALHLGDLYCVQTIHQRMLKLTKDPRTPKRTWEYWEQVCGKSSLAVVQWFHATFSQHTDREWLDKGLEAAVHRNNSSVFEFLFSFLLTQDRNRFFEKCLTVTGGRLFLCEALVGQKYWAPPRTFLPSLRRAMEEYLEKYGSGGTIVFNCPIEMYTLLYAHLHIYAPSPLTTPAESETALLSLHTGKKCEHWYASLRYCLGNQLFESPNADKDDRESWYPIAQHLRESQERVWNRQCTAEQSLRRVFAWELAPNNSRFAAIPPFLRTDAVIRLVLQNPELSGDWFEDLDSAISLKDRLLASASPADFHSYLQTCLAVRERNRTSRCQHSKFRWFISVLARAHGLHLSYLSSHIQPLPQERSDLASEILGCRGEHFLAACAYNHLAVVRDLVALCRIGPDDLDASTYAALCAHCTDKKTKETLVWLRSEWGAYFACSQPTKRIRYA